MTPLYRFLLTMLAMLPRRALQLMGALFGRLGYLLGTRAAQVTSANLALCFPAMDAADRKRLARRSLAATGKTLFETPAVWLGGTRRMDKWIADVHGEEHLRDAAGSGRGLIVLLPHVGNWELFNVYYRRWGGMTALYQPPRKKAFRQLVESVRKRHGNNMVATDRAGLRALYRALRRGETVVVLPDQVPEQGKYEPFFGVAALTDSLASRLADRTGAKALTAAVIRRRDGRFDVHVAPVRGNLAEAPGGVNRQVEWSVALAPEQYQWEYKRFRERPPGELKAYRFGKPPQRHA